VYSKAMPMTFRCFKRIRRGLSWKANNGKILDSQSNPYKNPVNFFDNVKLSGKKFDRDKIAIGIFWHNSKNHIGIVHA
jgi:hypothetical protein